MSYDPQNTRMNRRRFLALTTSAVVASGCSSVEAAGNTASAKERVINAGPAANYATDGVYDHFRDFGFFVIRNGEKLVALSAICTHRKCKLKAEPDCSFYCKCHGSTFNPAGHVTEGPAKRDLPVLTTSVNENGDLLVTVPTF
jgi:Rieske Fe-S protein